MFCFISTLELIQLDARKLKEDGVARAFHLQIRKYPLPIQQSSAAHGTLPKGSQFYHRTAIRAQAPVLPHRFKRRGESSEGDSCVGYGIKS